MTLLLPLFSKLNFAIAAEKSVGAELKYVISVRCNGIKNLVDLWWNTIAAIIITIITIIAFILNIMIIIRIGAPASGRPPLDAETENKS